LLKSIQGLEFPLEVIKELHFSIDVTYLGRLLCPYVLWYEKCARQKGTLVYALLNQAHEEKWA
jgi:hypothetical protein